MVRINSIIFQSEKSFLLKKGELLDLPKLQSDCLSKGIVSRLGKGFLAVKIDKTTFNVHSAGHIGTCYGKEINEVLVFDSVVPDFFWKNFAINCIKKRS